MTRTLEQFAEIVWRLARRTSAQIAPGADSQHTARAYMGSRPGTAEALLLGRILDAVRRNRGEFRDADARVLGTEALGIASALLASVRSRDQEP